MNLINPVEKKVNNLCKTLKLIPELLKVLGYIIVTKCSAQLKKKVNCVHLTLLLRYSFILQMQTR